MSREHFVVGELPLVDVGVKAGTVRLLEGDPGTVVVELSGSEEAIGAMEVFQAGDTVTVRAQSGLRSWFVRPAEVTITVPAGARASLRAASGDISGSVAMSDVSVELASGDLHLGDVSGDLTVDTASGDIMVASVAGDLSSNAASGDVRIREIIGHAVINAASGDVHLGRAVGSLTIQTASGDVDVRSFEGTDFVAQTMSGDVRVGLPTGLLVAADLHTRSGAIRNETSESASASGKSATLRIKTLSGDIVLRSAPA